MAGPCIGEPHGWGGVGGEHDGALLAAMLPHPRAAIIRGSAHVEHFAIEEHRTALIAHRRIAIQQSGLLKRQRPARLGHSHHSCMGVASRGDAIGGAFEEVGAVERSKYRTTLLAPEQPVQPSLEVAFHAFDVRRGQRGRGQPRRRSVGAHGVVQASEDVHRIRRRLRKQINAHPPSEGIAMWHQWPHDLHGCRTAQPQIMGGLHSFAEGGVRLKGSDAADSCSPGGSLVPRSRHPAGGYRKRRPQTDQKKEA
jgi:hypothetical protein